MQTLGEIAFGRYLTACAIPFTYEDDHSGRSKRPDFTISWRDTQCFFDVKDRQDGTAGLVIDNPLTSQDHDDEVFSAAIDPPYRWIREQIEQGRRKFREFKGFPCAIVMFAADGWGSDLLEPDFVLGAMYGDYGIVIPRNPSTGQFDSADARSQFLDNGKMIRPRWRTPQNTTISALVTLRALNVGEARLRRYIDTHYPGDASWWDLDIQAKVDFDITERRSGVVVWENVFAATPLPSDLFRSACDERWSSDGRVLRRTHLGDIVAECLPYSA